MIPLWRLNLGGLPGIAGKVGQKELHLWLGAWLRDRARKTLAPTVKGTRHLLFALCDHYEPLHGGVPAERALARVKAWRQGYPALARNFSDANGRPPQHTFFYPGEQYAPEYIEPLAEMVEMGLGEVEVHLHHDGDTRDTLRRSLEKTLSDLGSHGVMPAKDGAYRWAFIHGNWCLANARRDGRYCGVDDEIPLLHELGCYADFTFPSAPDESQPGVVNAIYYPAGRADTKRAYESAEVVRVGSPKRDTLLMIEGPLALARRPRSREIRIESAALDGGDPPTASRLSTWVDQRVGVVGRPEWVFVKVHTHGAPERNAEALLGEVNAHFHEALSAYNDGANWQLHYVTAREMYNVARAAMDGNVGSPARYFDYEVAPAARRKRSVRGGLRAVAAARHG